MVTYPKGFCGLLFGKCDIRKLTIQVLHYESEGTNTQKTKRFEIIKQVINEQRLVFLGRLCVAGDAIGVPDVQAMEEVFEFDPNIPISLAPVITCGAPLNGSELPISPNHKLQSFLKYLGHDYFMTHSLTSKKKCSHLTEASYSGLYWTFPALCPS